MGGGPVGGGGGEITREVVGQRVGGSHGATTGGKDRAGGLGGETAGGQKTVGGGWGGTKGGGGGGVGGMTSCPNIGPTIR